MKGRLGVVAGAVVTVAGVAVAATMLGTSSSPGPASLPRPHVPVAPGQVSAADLTEYHWGALPDAPIPTRQGGVVSVWTGTEMIVWGGYSSAEQVMGDGASYDPGDRSWQRLPTGPLSPRYSAAFAWTGRQLFIWGGSTRSSELEGIVEGSGDGALYDPATRTWRQLPPVSVGGHAIRAAVWTGTRVVLFTAAFEKDTNTAGVHAYDPATDSWSTLPSIRIAQTQLLGIIPLVAGDQLYAFMPVQTIGSGLQTGNDSFVYRPRTNTWAESPMLPAPDGRAIGPAEWTGDHILFGPAGVACNLCSPHPGESPGSWADPRTGAVQRIPPWLENSYSGSTFSWTGAAVLAVGDHAYAAAWDPLTNTWTHLARPPYQGGAVQIWTGTELLIWGQLYEGPSSDPSTRPPPVDTAGMEFSP